MAVQVDPVSCLQQKAVAEVYWRVQEEKKKKSVKWHFHNTVPSLRTGNWRTSWIKGAILAFNSFSWIFLPLIYPIVFLAYTNCWHPQFSLAKADHVQKHLSVFDLTLPSAFDLSLPIIHSVPPNPFPRRISKHLFCFIFYTRYMVLYHISSCLKRIMHQENKLGMLFPKHGAIMFISPQYWNFSCNFLLLILSP